MRVQDAGAVGVFDGDVVSSPLGGAVAGVGDDPAFGSADGRTDWGGEVEAGVVASPDADLTEWRGDSIALHGSDSDPRIGRNLDSDVGLGSMPYVVTWTWSTWLALALVSPDRSREGRLRIRVRASEVRRRRY